MRRPYLLAASVLAVVTVTFYFSVSARAAMRMTRDSDVSTKYFGTQTYADPESGLVPAQDQFGAYERRQRIVDARDWPRAVLVEDRYVVRDLGNGSVLFDYTTRERVDPRTGAWAAEDHKGEIVVFPRNTEKRTYVMRSNYLEGIPLRFVGEDDVGGLDTYIFAYRGPINYTTAYKGTAEFPGVPVDAGQEIRCSDDQFYYRTWIEPTTGIAVKVEEGCRSGSYIYDAATGKRIRAVDRWTGAAAGADLARRVSEVHKERELLLLYTRYIPAFFAALSVLLLLLGLRRPPRPSSG